MRAREYVLSGRAPWATTSVIRCHSPSTGEIRSEASEPARYGDFSHVYNNRRFNLGWCAAVFLL